jgi:acetylornithine deacetylase/succinyl-diaminopimelate desuccinylase-like protein
MTVRILLPIITLIILSACEGSDVSTVSADASEPVVRPDFSYEEIATFSPTEVPVYEGEHTAVYRYIDDNLDDHIEALRRWVRQPSVSAQDIGVRQMAEILRDDMLELGFAEAELVPTAGHPGVWGYFDAGAEKTLMIYLMYDVQPVEPEDWHTPPFAGNLVEHELGTVLMARGATNQKGPQRALFNAIEAIVATEGTLPVNLMVTAEGEEELGSPNFPEIIDRYEDRLKTADGVLFPFNSQTAGGRVMMNLGVKGIIYFEMESRGGDHGGPMRSEIHGSYKAITDAPGWRLVQALSSLTSEDGNTILVPGYYDGIRPPTQEEQRLINGMLADWNDEQMQTVLGVNRWIDGRTGRDAILDYLYLPTLNIDGIWGGYTGPGTKTILPHVVTAKVDSRLPMGMDHESAMAKIQQHLIDQGFGDIKITLLGGYPPAQTSVSSPLVQDVIGVFRKRGYDMAVRPRVAGSAPFYQFTERLGLPMVFAGVGHGSGAHAPNEYMVIEPAEDSGIAGLADVEKFYADVIFALGENQ